MKTDAHEHDYGILNISNQLNTASNTLAVAQSDTTT